jgi:hypothetical protein
VIVCGVVVLCGVVLLCGVVVFYSTADHVRHDAVQEGRQAGNP